MKNDFASLGAVPKTLSIPLAARALGASLFPAMALDDRHASQVLATIGEDGQQWLQAPDTIYGTLARIRWFRDSALAFLQQHPDSTVCSLGCGLSDYLQWIDNGQMRMVDADLPEVMAIRRALMPPKHDRHQLLPLDLCDAGWWDSLSLPASRQGAPVFLLSEGVLMYLPPETVSSILATFGERAPAGSMLVFDTMCWLSIGRARHHPSLKHTEAEILWGPRRPSELTCPHERLRLLEIHQVMGGYSLAHKLLQPVFKALTGIPYYALYRLGV